MSHSYTSQKPLRFLRIPLRLSRAADWTMYQTAEHVYTLCILLGSTEFCPYMLQWLRPDLPGLANRTDSS